MKKLNAKNLVSEERRWPFWVGLLFILCGVAVAAFASPTPEVTDMALQPDRVTTGCVKQETLHYAICGHEVMRRVDVPSAWLGMDRAQVAASLKENTRITGFAASRIDLQTRLELFCPQHVVLITNAEGRVCYAENRYGEAMVEMNATPWRAVDLPMAEQEALRQGIAFDTREEADQYMARWEPV